MGNCLVLLTGLLLLHIYFLISTENWTNKVIFKNTKLKFTHKHLLII